MKGKELNQLGSCEVFAAQFGMASPFRVSMRLLSKKEIQKVRLHTEHFLLTSRARQPLS